MVTAGHKHRHVNLTNRVLYRTLRKPRFKTRSLQRAERSRYPYAGAWDTQANEPYYYLSLLGILHRWTGLTVRWRG